MTLKPIINDFSGGLNDTPMIERRLPTEAGVLTNFRPVEDGMLERVSGRDLITTETITTSSVTFTGAGLNDATIVKTGVTVAGRSYIFEIVTGGVTSPNTFRWSKDGTNWEATLNCTVAAQAITDTVTIAFAAIVGHTAGNRWSFTTALTRGAFTGTGGDTATKITGLLCPLRKAPLVTLTSTDNALRVSVGGVETVVSLAVGAYYTYDELGAALAAALGTTLPATWTIAYTAATKAFTMGAANAGTATVIFSWKHSKTTLDPTLFGFRYGSISATNPIAFTSTFPVAAEPPSRNMVATDGAWYNVDAAGAKTKVTLPSGDNPDSSTGDVVGGWQNDRGYFSNQKKNHVIRTLREIREYPEKDAVKLASNPTVTAGDHNLYSYTDGFATALTLTEAIGSFRLDLGTMTPGLADQLRLVLARENVAGYVDLKFYHEVPSLGYRNLIGTINSSQLFVGSGSVFDLQIEEVFGVGDATDSCIVAEYDPAVAGAAANPDIYIYGTDIHAVPAATDGPVYYLDTDGCWALYHPSGDADHYLKWYGHLKVNGQTYAGTSSRLRIGLENPDHFETDLGEYHPLTLTQSYRDAVAGEDSLALAGLAQGIVVHPSGNYAYLGLGPAGMQVVDITDPTNIAVPAGGTSGLVDTTDAKSTSLVMTSASAHSDTYIALADGAGGVKTVDVSTPASPTIEASPHTLATTDARAVTPAWIGTTSYLLVADGRSGLRVATCASTGHLALYSTKALAGTSQGIYYSAPYAYVPAGKYGVHIVDVSVPLTPVHKGRCIVPRAEDGAHSCCKSGDYLYVVTKRHLYVYNVANPALPRRVNVLTLGTTQLLNSITIYEDMAYIGFGSVGLLMVDIGNPEGTLSITKTFATNGRALCAVVDATHPAGGPLPYTYIADGEGGISVVPAANPAEAGSSYAESYVELVITKPSQDQDWQWINIYRCKGQDPIADDASPVYYLWAQVPRELALSESAATITLRMALADTELEKNAEAPAALRSTSLIMKLACLWKERMWFTTDQYPGRLFRSEANEPEHQDDVYGFYQIGEAGEAITALAPLSDRLVVCKASSIHLIAESGDDYAVVNGPVGGAGAASSAIVPDLGSGGTTVLTLGSDGHLWRTDGYEAACLSRKRLTTTVAGLLSLTATAGIYTPASRELLLSVCSAGSTPSQNIIYQLDQNRFYLDAMPAERWALDRVSAAVPRIMGAAALDIFWYRLADADLRGDVLARYRGDWDFDTPQDPKFFLSIRLSCYAKTARNIRVRWFINGSSTQTGEKILAITTTPATYSIPVGGRGERFGLEIRDNDAGGWMRISQIEVECTVMKKVRL